MLQGLERKLSTLSHSEDAIKEVKLFCSSLSGTQARLNVWTADRALLRKPIEREGLKHLGFGREEDDFVLLQGDLVRTESAYSFGQRITGKVLYAVLNSSCDLVPGRASSSVLLPVHTIKRTDHDASRTLGELAKFSRKDSMYIPPLEDDEEDVAGNAIRFDGVCQIRTSDLHLANRIASLSVVGWLIFGAFSRSVFTRANPREIEMRRAVEQASAAA